MDFNIVLNMKLFLAILSFYPLEYMYVPIGLTNDGAKSAWGHIFVFIPHYPLMLAWTTLSASLSLTALLNTLQSSHSVHKASPHGLSLDIDRQPDL